MNKQELKSYLQKTWGDDRILMEFEDENTWSPNALNCISGVLDQVDFSTSDNLYVQFLIEDQENIVYRIERVAVEKY